jgi:hypothetical protein
MSGYEPFGIRGSNDAGNKPGSFGNGVPENHPVLRVQIRKFIARKTCQSKERFVPGDKRTRFDADNGAWQTVFVEGST